MDLKQIVKIACPEYTGRKITEGTIAPKYLDSYWDEGHRSFYHLVRLADRFVNTLHSNHPGFEPTQPRYLVNDLPTGWALVAEHHAGMKTSIQVYLGTGIDQFPVLRA